MSTAADYIGRVVDVAAFQGTSARGDALLRQKIADDGQSGLVVTGIVKLGQRFLLELFTERGTMPFQPTRGSTFMTELRSGGIRVTSDLLAAFSRALISIGSNLVSDELDSDPDDERFSDAQITQVELSAGNAVIYIELSSLAVAPPAVIPIALAI